MKTALKLLATAALISTTSWATSAATIVGPPDGVTGIEDLEVNGTFYDVTFTVLGPYNNRHPDPDNPEFLNDTPSSSAARAAILQVIYDAGNITQITNMNTNFWFFERNAGPAPIYVVVPDALTATNVNGSVFGWVNTIPFGPGNTVSGRFGGDGLLRTGNYGNIRYASFVEVPAPIPSPTAAIVGLVGLAGLGMRRRRG